MLVFRADSAEQPGWVGAGLVDETQQDFRRNSHTGLVVVPGSRGKVEPPGQFRPAVLAERFPGEFLASGEISDALMLILTFVVFLRATLLDPPLGNPPWSAWNEHRHCSVAVTFTVALIGIRMK